MATVASHIRRSRPSKWERRGFWAALLLLALVVGAGVVVPYFSAAHGGRMQPVIDDMNHIKVALAIFDMHTGLFPTTKEGLGVLVTNPGYLKNWSQTLEKVPFDPWGRPYVYRSPGTNGSNYDLYCTGPSGQDGNADNIQPGDRVSDE